MKEVLIWTDGACVPNPGTGGWAAIVKYKSVEREVSGCEFNTTNNRMELLAAINGLMLLKEACVVRLYSDSQYLTRTMSGHYKKNKNLDLWKELDSLNRVHQIKWSWVRGHSTDKMNIRCDELAVYARKMKFPTSVK